MAAAKSATDKQDKSTGEVVSDLWALLKEYGKQETIAYVLEGDCAVRWGERGEFSAAAHAGDFIHVPAWLPHMEINPSEDHRFVWVVVRSTAQPIVINLPDDYWK